MRTRRRWVHVGMAAGLIVAATGSIAAADSSTTGQTERPWILYPWDEDEVSGSDVPVNGIGEPGARITVELNGSPVDSARVDQSGDWDGDLGDFDVGEHTISATQYVDGEQSGHQSVTVHVYPTRPVSFVLPEDGATVDAVGTSVQIAGDTDASVEVTARGEVVGTGTIPPGDDLLLDLAELPTGEQTLTVEQTVDGEDEVTRDSIDVTVTPTTTAH